ncbi:MAG: DNA repair protein RecN [Xanthomonadales bacterium]|nr:DNA repair protein RecN [Xanthomonadales bacterium]NIX11741.1 DNA repair protein RecN [Xanthomonadales bacterium]
MDALGLLLGDRSDSSWVRPGAERAELGATFDLSDNAPAVRWLADRELGGDPECLLRRSISAGGRSRAWINGIPVTLQQLAELGSLLVELHGQNEHISLTSRSRQLELLDASGDYEAQISKTRDAHGAWKALDTELNELLQSAALPPGEIDLLRFQLGELNQHALEPDVLADLETEHRRLASGGALIEGLARALERLEAEDLGITGGLQNVLQSIETFAELDPGITDAVRILQEASINCAEATLSLRQASDRIDLDPGRLEDVSGRLAALGDLSRKHRVPMEKLCVQREALAARLENAEHFDQRRDELDSRLSVALERYRAAATELSASRSRHADKLSASVAALMAELGMPGGQFEIRVEPDPESEPSPGGDDQVALMVSANPGMPVGPLAKIASGGELSRISLAIKAATRRGGGGLTQIFDEVDAGIGGETANAVGLMLYRLASGGQALCVTHLAQVAAFAAHHLQVNKDTSGDSTHLAAALLDAGGRTDEVARMLSGRVSDQSRAHAAELLDAAGAQARAD